jgi:hypothetical protein
MAFARKQIIKEGFLKPARISHLLDGFQHPWHYDNGYLVITAGQSDIIIATRDIDSNRSAMGIKSVKLRPLLIFGFLILWFFFFLPSIIAYYLYYLRRVRIFKECVAHINNNIRTASRQDSATAGE